MLGVEFNGAFFFDWYVVVGLYPTIYCVNDCVRLYLKTDKQLYNLLASHIHINSNVDQTHAWFPNLNEASYQVVREFLVDRF